jgi:hypothetical protein
MVYTKSLKSTYEPYLEEKETFIVIDGTSHAVKPPQKPKISASTVLGTLKDYEFNIEIAGIDIEIRYFSYIDRLEVFINHNEDIEIQFSLADINPLEEFIKPVSTSLFERYTPVFGYTQKSKRSISLMKSHSNKTILPMLVVGTDSKFEHYKQDNLKDSHFLDLSLLYITSNKEEREEVSLFNEGKKRDDKKPMPSKIYEKVKSYSIIDSFFIQLQEKKHVIPTLRISLEHAASLYFAQAISKLLLQFNKVAIRITLEDKNFSNLQSFLLAISNDLNRLYLIIESDGEDLKNEHKDLLLVQKLSDKIEIIYLCENIKNRNSIKDNEDTTTYNQSIISFKNLQPYHPKLNYADYCGFEKDTSVEPGGFLARTAKIFYSNILNIDEYLIRRERASTNNWGDAMDLLQDHIKKYFKIDKNHCEACLDIDTKSSRFTLGDIKENCIIHNGICIAKA